MSASANVFYKCQTCKAYFPATKTCQLMIPQLAGTVEPTDYCSKYINELHQCEICHNGLLIPIVETQNDEVHIYCSNCLAQRETQMQQQKQEEGEHE
jgi:hypothetical protein